MIVAPVSGYNIAHKSSVKIPKSASIKHQDKIDNIQCLKLASAFKEFENNLRTIMETFIYTIKY